MCKNNIIGVAIKHGDLVVGLPKPNRHHHVIKHLVKVLGINKPVGHKGQSFYLADGTYINRQEARKLAIKSGQCSNPEHSTELFSEDLW